MSNFLNTGTINKVMLVGYIIKEPELVELNDENVRASFVIATKREWINDQQELKSFYDWHRVVCFGNLAKSIVERAKKRNLSVVEGRIQTRQWKDEKGESRYITEIVIDGNSGKFITLRKVKETTEIIDKNAEIKQEELSEEQKEALMIDEIEKMLNSDIDFKVMLES